MTSNFALSPDHSVRILRAGVGAIKRSQASSIMKSLAKTTVNAPFCSRVSFRAPKPLGWTCVHINRKCSWGQVLKGTHPVRGLRVP